MSPRVTSFADALGLDAARLTGPQERRLAKAIEDGLERVEAELARQLDFADAVADASGRYLLLAGGKRVRPVLTLLTAQLGEGATEDVIQAAAAMELTHLASLYHDDVMDEATLRRGVPSAQAVYGNSIAILTGDLLFARASRLVAELGVEAIRMQAGTFERLVRGQLHETAGPQDGEDPFQHYLQVLADKTGSLIASAAESGVRFSGADRSLIAPLRSYGEQVGIAFQLVDDVLDLSADPAVTGKAAGTDLRAGVPTMPVLLLRQAGEADLLEQLESADDAVFAQGVATLRTHDVTGRTLGLARERADQAIAALGPVGDGVVKRSLIEFANRVVERKS